MATLCPWSLSSISGPQLSLTSFWTLHTCSTYDESVGHFSNINNGQMSIISFHLLTDSLWNSYFGHQRWSKKIKTKFRNLKHLILTIRVFVILSPKEIRHVCWGLSILIRSCGPWYHMFSRGCIEKKKIAKETQLPCLPLQKIAFTDLNFASPVLYKWVLTRVVSWIMAPQIHSGPPEPMTMLLT